ncbi:glutamate racemase [Marinirhabdus gelatinilytica]|uniref:Glutamate racemase n=1 Tax=Marinirhabdus gelatinilytica TaxID=1703343 RepID=A0A370Q3X3_9FLAO|nr:glutamate racemase [Marinirhabdus gelatinilytica]RDK83009.1 glutamate racemase [Marinirhabdus gelatinilytica]
MKKTAPIGIFDSGVGGTSIWKEIHQLLPNENTIYLADSANAPYGNRSEAEIVSLSIKNTEKLISLGCKIIVVACNTATTNAVDILRKNYEVPIIGIEPAIKPAALQTQSKSIGILATKGTLSSALFHKTSEAFTKDISVIEIVGEGLVPLIEKGALESQELKELLTNYTAPMLAANIDYLVLGCSHYPYLIPNLKKILPPTVTIIDSGEAVAKQTKKTLEKIELLSEENKQPSLQFYTNTEIDTLTFLLKAYSKNISIQQKEF